MFESSRLGRVVSVVLGSSALLFGCAELLGLKEDQSRSVSEIGDGGGHNHEGNGNRSGSAGEAVAGGESGGARDESQGGAPSTPSNEGQAGEAPVTGDNPPECSSPEDCPGTDNECGKRTCADGACGMDFEKKGSIIEGQTTGDCQLAICDGHGVVVTEADDSDVPKGSNPCMLDGCREGEPTHDPASKTTTCGATGQFKCDGNGACGGCTASSDCGLSNLCATYTCMAGTCMNSFVPSGQGNLSNTAGDCKKNVCDGAGSMTTIADDGDLPDDNNPCTKNVCSGGAPSHPNESATKSCGAYSTCNGQGTCLCSDPPANACPRLGAQCGTVTNGCGAQVTCTNTCSGVNTCNGAGNPNGCGCTPVPKNCGYGQCGGTVTDNCGNVKDCSASCESFCQVQCTYKTCVPSGSAAYCNCQDCLG